MVGGAKGAVIGLTVGLALGTALDATIFNFDGELSKTEFVKCLITAAGFVAGGAIGFLAGIAIAGIASLIGRKTKKAILEKRAENAKNEIEKYIKASERSFKESVNKNFDQFFESAYKAFKEIIENRQSERNNLLADFNTTSVMDKTELENDLQFVEQRKNDIRNV